MRASALDSNSRTWIPPTILSFSSEDGAVRWTHVHTISYSGTLVNKGASIENAMRIPAKSISQSFEDAMQLESLMRGSVSGLACVEGVRIEKIASQVVSTKFPYPVGVNIDIPHAAREYYRSHEKPFMTVVLPSVRIKESETMLVDLGPVLCNSMDVATLGGTSVKDSVESKFQHQNGDGQHEMLMRHSLGWKILSKQQDPMASSQWEMYEFQACQQRAEAVQVPNALIVTAQGLVQSLLDRKAMKHHPEQGWNFKITRLSNTPRRGNSVLQFDSKNDIPPSEQSAFDPSIDQTWLTIKLTLVLVAPSIKDNTSAEGQRLCYRV